VTESYYVTSGFRRDVDVCALLERYTAYSGSSVGTFRDQIVLKRRRVITILRCVTPKSADFMKNEVPWVRTFNIGHPTCAWMACCILVGTATCFSGVGIVKVLCKGCHPHVPCRIYIMNTFISRWFKRTSCWRIRSAMSVPRWNGRV
jgi:hypothetical protein